MMWESCRRITTSMHTDRREVISWSSKLSVAGDWERYVAEIQKFQSLEPIPNLELLQC